MKIVDHVNNGFDSLALKLRVSNPLLKKIITVFIFVISVHLLFTHVGIYKFINIRPCGIHSSAQCQRASVALNYYKADMNFFAPRIQRNITGEGITGVEFPVIYYTAAVAYKLFGFNEVYLRVINLLIVIMGAFLFYLLAVEYIKNRLLAMLLVGSACLSPVLLYYSPNFLPDAPSFGFVLGAWYFLFKYLKSDKTKHLNLFILFASLAALIKVIAIMCMIVVICLIVLDKLRFFKCRPGEILFKNKLKVLIRIALGMVSIFAWYYYARWLSQKYNNQGFALSPIMADNLETLGRVWEHVKNVWTFQYYSYESYVLILCSLIVIIAACKIADRLLVSIALLYTLGSIGYVYFFTYQFKDHDYYIIAILPAVFFWLLSFGNIISKLSVKYFRPLSVILIIVLIFNMKEAIRRCKENYYSRNLYDIAYLGAGDYRGYNDLEKVLRKNGIQRTDRVLSGYDHTYCSSLYLMDQLGTVFSKDNNSPEEIKRLLNSKELKYLVLNDSTGFSKTYDIDLSNKVIDFHRGLLIYKLR